jgi:hypothetical protein
MNNNKYFDFGTPISFSYAAQYLDRKTQTRREWKDSHATKFVNAYDRAVAAGQQLRVPAIDKGYRTGGKQIGWCVISKRPYQQPLRDMPDADLAAEGGMCSTVADFISQYFKGRAKLEVWVIQFEFVSLEPTIGVEVSGEPKPEPRPAPIEEVSRASKSLQALTSSNSDEHNTPKFLIDAARAIMGGIDLDPMSNAIANRTIRAHRIYTKANDGLTKPWIGRVWLNPPFSLANRAVPRLIQSYESGDVFEAVLLLKSAVDTKRYQLLYPYPFVELNKRVNYVSPDNKYVSPFATTLFYFGSNFPRWRQIMSDYGRVHPGGRVFAELESDRLRLLNQVAVLKGETNDLVDIPTVDIPELKHHGKCQGHGCSECDFGWSRETNWNAVSERYQEGWNPSDLPSWFARS